ncbi:MAG: hypothetical protein GX383_03165 [Clostridium sp.]|jgi:hypothetical protein|nr:hypothetical protein [Clostridium sp.]
MADTFTIRISKDTPAFEEMDKAAEQLGLSRNQLIIEGIKMICSWNAQFYKKMKQYSNTFRLPVPLVIQNMLIKRLAEDYAKEQIWGFTGKVLSEFMFNERGSITGGELFKTLSEMAVKDEIRERVRGIEEHIRTGFPVSKDEMEFYEAHKPKPVKIDPKEEERNRQLFEKYGEPVSGAFWADETSMEEAVKMLQEEEKKRERGKK